HLSMIFNFARLSTEMNEMNEIKELLISLEKKVIVIEETIKNVRKDLDDMRKDLDDMRKDLDDLRKDFNEFKDKTTDKFDEIKTSIQLETSATHLSLVKINEILTNIKISWMASNSSLDDNKCYINNTDNYYVYAICRQYMGNNYYKKKVLVLTMQLIINYFCVKK
ncbi:hypothetical protein BpHYR1_030685, partial [Brachionus plicatilis]